MFLGWLGVSGSVKDGWPSVPVLGEERIAELREEGYRRAAERESADVSVLFDRMESDDISTELGDIGERKFRSVELGRWASSDTGEPFGDWRLPGMGESGPRCGEVSAVGFCDAAGHIKFAAHGCGRRECPDCWSHEWAGPRTVSVASRLAAARYVASTAAEKRALHVVVSPPELPNTIEGFYQGRRRANEIAKEHGIRGGVVIAHGYRALDSTKQEYEQVKPEVSLWRWIRENDTGWREQVFWSPHYHIVGLADPDSRDPETGQPGHIIPGTERSDDWVFKNIRSLERYEGLNDRDGLKDMVGVVRYLLSHTSFPRGEDRQSVTWFGALHGTNFSPEEELSKGSWDKIQRVAEELVGASRESDTEDGVSDGEVCEVDGCEGRVHDIWEANMFLETVGGFSPEVEIRIRSAYRWLVGDLEPPPGMKNPRTIEQAEEALEHIINQ